MQIVIANDHAAVHKIFKRRFTGGIAKLMHCNRRINKVIGVPSLPDRRGFKNLMSFKTAAFAVRLAGSDIYRTFHDSQHIRCKLYALVPGS